ncbi:MAG: HAD family hydrolase [Parachlamydiales bacterium]
MLIIFDLDDTLIDTTNSITPFVLKKTLQSLIEHGLKVDNEDASYKKLLEIDKNSSGSKETVKSFLNSINEEKFYELSLDIMKKISIDDIKIFTLKNAIQVVQYLSKNNILAIVTRGDKKFQLTKIKKAGIDPSLFSKIVVVRGKNKGYHYKKILNDTKMSPEKTYVCGDRVNIDLLPAKKLGCRTIHMKWGRGKNFKKDKNVDYTIQNLKKLKEILG